MLNSELCADQSYDQFRGLPAGRQERRPRTISIGARWTPNWTNAIHAKFSLPASAGTDNGDCLPPAPFWWVAVRWAQPWRTFSYARVSSHFVSLIETLSSLPIYSGKHCLMKRMRGNLCPKPWQRSATCARLTVKL